MKAKRACSIRRSPCLIKSNSDLALASMTLVGKRGRAEQLTVSATNAKEDLLVKLRILLVLAFILTVPVFFGSTGSRTQSPLSLVAMAQCPDGSHGTAGNCVPDSPTSPGSPNPHPTCTTNPVSSSPVHTDRAPDLGTGMVAGLMALGVGLLFWLRMR